MREILFRGKHKDDWVTGGILRSGGIYYIVVPLHKNPYGLIRVNQDTIGQYTGLDDCYGNRIFEGDIVYSEYDEEYGEVKFDKKDYAFLVSFGTWEIPLRVFGRYGLEVRGNKWDNKELLEK